MPNIVMAVSAGRVNINDTCMLQIHRPVSLNTVLFILNTPVEHEPPRHDHQMCSSVYGMFDDFGPGETLPDCTRVQPERRPMFRPVETITRVDLKDGGYIHDRSSIQQPPTTTTIMLRETEIRLGAPRGDRSGLVETAVQLLQVSARQTIPSNFADQDTAAIEAGNIECMFAPKYVPWHIKLALNDDEADDLVNQVRPSWLKASFYKSDAHICAADRSLRSPRAVDSANPDLPRNRRM